MKIAMIRSAVHRHGGAERYVWHLSREMDARGHEVHVIARRCPELPAPSIRFHPVRVSGLFSFSKVRSFARGVDEILENERFDVVHSCDRINRCDVYHADEGLHREWLRASSPRLSSWARFVRSLDPLHKVLLGLEENLMGEGGAKIETAISRKGGEEVERHFGLKKVPVIYNSVDAEEFRPPEGAEREEIRNRIGLAEDDFAALYVGTGFFRKGLRHLIEGLARMKSPRGGRTPRLLARGRGARGACERLARAHGVGERFRFVDDDISTALLYRAADAFALPSLYEPFGSTYLEAMASGLPCVFSSRSGAAEIITDGKEGFVLDDPTDADEIARLLCLCMDEEKAAAMGAAARALSLKFTWRANADATERLYREIIESRGRGS